MTFSEKALILKYFSKLKIKQVAIDVGAHQGFFSEDFAKAGWEIVAFEPELHNFEILKQKIGHYPSVHLLRKAVSDEHNSHQPFFVSSDHYGIHSLKPFHSTHQQAYMVETVRLDQAISELKIQNVALLKIDIEGADFLALKGFDFGKYQPEVVMAEFMDERSMKNFSYTHHDMVDFMRDFDYATFVSEWSPVKEYGREGVAGEPHQWLRCIPYPTSYPPAWGNLIFIPYSKADLFHQVLNTYVTHVRTYGKLQNIIFRLRKTSLVQAPWQKFKSLLKTAKIRSYLDVGKK